MIGATYAVHAEQLGTEQLGTEQLGTDAPDLGLPAPQHVRQCLPESANRWNDGYRAVFVDGRDCTTVTELCWLLASLRDLEARGFWLSWAAPRGLADLVADWWLLTHLPAPVLGWDPDVLAEWRAAYRFGRLRWFRGPGFVKVLDQRRDAGAILTLSGRTLVAFVERACAGGPFRSSEPWCQAAVDEALDRCLDAGIVLRLGDEQVWLAGRVQRWSHPSQVMAP